MDIGTAEDYAPHSLDARHEGDSILYLQADGLALGQFTELFRSTHYHTPEVSLMIAVLEEAIGTFLRYRSGHTRKERRRFNEVETWIFRPSEDYVFSFENVCEVLRVDAGYIRRLLRPSAGDRPIEHSHSMVAAGNSRIDLPRSVSLKDRVRQSDYPPVAAAKRKSLRKNRHMRKSLRPNWQNVGSVSQ
jgi:hypothetical protein